MQANLMGAAGFDAHAHQSELAKARREPPDDLVVRDGRAGSLSLGFAVMRVRRIGSRLTPALMVPFWHGACKTYNVSPLADARLPTGCSGRGYGRAV